MVSLHCFDSRIHHAVSLAERVTGMVLPLKTVQLSSLTTEDTADIAAAEEDMDEVEDLSVDSILMADAIEDLSADSDIEFSEPKRGEGEPSLSQPNKEEQPSLQPNKEMVAPPVALKWECPVVSLFVRSTFIVNVYRVCKFCLTSLPWCTI